MIDFTTDENDERHCHIFIKGCSKEDYDDFFRATGYIENTQETGAVTSVFLCVIQMSVQKRYIIFPGRGKRKRKPFSAKLTDYI